MAKRALVLGSGGLLGAYSAGFCSELCRKVGPNYFNTIYCYSVGSTIGSFFVSNQPEVIEKTWESYVCDNQLIKPFNIFLGKPVLDLDYLISLFKGKISHLDIDSILNSKTELNFILVDYCSGEISFKKAREENILDLIKASCSLPIAHGPSKVGNHMFLDASFVAGGLPGLDGIIDEYDEVLVVLNIPLNYKPKKIWQMFIKFFPVISYFYPKPLRQVFKNKEKNIKKTISFLNKNKKVILVTPNRNILNSGSDGSKKRIVSMINHGKRDALYFLQNQKTKNNF